MRARALGLIALGLLAGTAAIADTISQFSVSGTFNYNSSTWTFQPGSTITIDTTSGLATSEAMTLSDGISETLGFTGAPSFNTSTEYAFFATSESGPYICIPCVVDLQNTAGTGFVGFAGGPLTGGWLYDHPLSQNTPNNAGEILLTPTSVPEPTTLSLFGLGLGAVGLMRRRISK